MTNGASGTGAGAKAAGRRARHGTPLSPGVLLVGADTTWSRAVRGAANAVGGGIVDAVPSGRAALRRLLDRHPYYNHVLMNPARDDGLLPTILGMTSDEESSGIATVLLGRSTGAPPHVPVLPAPHPQAIRALFGAAGGSLRPVAPSVAALRTALADRRIDTRYQPVVRLADRRPAGVEALARLYCKGRGMLAPEHFVPRIEDAGLAAEFTRLVCGRSLADISAPALAPQDLTVALNFPLNVLLLGDALSRLEAARLAAGLPVPASRIVIELTESQAVDDPSVLRRVVEHFRAAGYGVAIDDISPAMPVAALLDLPFTAVKLDKEMVTRCGTNGRSDSFVERVIAAAKARGLIVVVEGVSDRLTWTRMRDAGADLAQGFAISRPLPASVLPDWAAVWDSRTDLG